MSDIIRYQWIKGDDQGILEELSDSEGKFLQYASGRRCNKELIGEYIIEIQHDSEIMSFEGEAEMQKPKRKPKPSVLETKVGKTPSNPIIPVLEKAKTKKTKLNIRMEMELPSKEFISVLEDSFDENVLEILSSYIASKIENPKDFLKDQILNSINDWYKKG